MKRIFLGWDRPALPLAVDVLVEQFASAEPFDFAELTVVVPGGRAGRRLLELLVQRAEEAGRPLSPPRIVTLGRLPERLYEAKRPFANDLTQQLAWVESLRSLPSDAMESLMPRPPEPNDLGGWLALGEMLGRLHRELAAEALDFAAVAARGDSLPHFQEQDRWQTLCRLQRDYLALLDRQGLWDMQTARLFAVREGECKPEHPIVLVGTVDMNQLQRMMLTQAADQVTSLVFAPPDLADRFDEFGCLMIDAWREATVTLDDRRIEVVDAPADQAAAALRAIAQLNGRFSADEITLGVPDARLVPHLLQQLRQCDLAARHGVGEPVGRSGPALLLAAAADYLAQRQFATLAALARHPDMADWIEKQGVSGDWLSGLDRYQNDHLPSRLDGRWLGKPEDHAAIKSVYEALEKLLAPLTGVSAEHQEGSARAADKKVKPLAEWGPAVCEVLLSVYGGRSLSVGNPRDQAVLAACEAIYGRLDEHRDVPDALAPRVDAAEAIRLALRAAAGEPIAAPSMSEAIELLGWLELPLDDAPVLIVTGLNEGVAPASLGADLFLPNQMRHALGIEDNDRRWARDVYALSVLSASRRHLKLIAGRRSPEGDPMYPSRLLLLDDPKTTARRVRRFFGEHPSATAPPPAPGRLVPGRIESGFVVPRPVALAEPVESMRVTEFRDYLACPYRYYLRHRLKLEGLDDRAEELDGGAFGSAAHEVLGQWAADPSAQSADVEELARFFDAALNRVLRRVYGGSPLAAVRVQAEQLRLRLRQLARWQSDWTAQGWRIEHVEWEPPADAPVGLDVDGRRMGLRGRIDRIDFHPTTGRWMVLDYKTSDTVKKPDATHRRQGQWVDLQLPLYRHLAAGLGVKGPIGLGYIALPKDIDQVGLLEAEWSDADLRDADEAARCVVRDIWAGRFEPVTRPAPPMFEEFAAICQDGQFGAADEDDSDADEEEDAA